MNVEEARKVAKERIEQLAAELERGQSECLQAYLKAMARFPRYSVGNTLLILAQKPDAERCAGLRTWNRLGRAVRKGEHGIAILAPVVRRRRTVDDGRRKETAETTASEGNETEEVVVGFRAAYVFDVSQTEGAPLAEFARVAGDPGKYSDRLKAYAAAKGITLEYSHRIAPARGACTGSTIFLMPNLDPAEHLSTLAHEIGHALLHTAGNADGVSRTVRETEAEAVAFVVCQAVGLDSMAASADYVTLYRGDAKTLAASLERVQRAAGEIIAAIGPDL